MIVCTNLYSYRYVIMHSCYYNDGMVPVVVELYSNGDASQINTKIKVFFIIRPKLRFEVDIIELAKITAIISAFCLIFVLEVYYFDC